MSHNVHLATQGYKMAWLLGFCLNNDLTQCDLNDFFAWGDIMSHLKKTKQRQEKGGKEDR